MAGHDIPVGFDVTVAYSGFSAAFHGQAFQDAQVSEPCREGFQADPPDATLFVRKDNGQPISARRLFRWFLKRSDSAPIDHVPRAILVDAFECGEAVHRRECSFEFAEGLFVIETDRGAADLRSLTLQVRLVVRPKQK